MFKFTKTKLSRLLTFLADRLKERSTKVALTVILGAAFGVGAGTVETGVTLASAVIGLALVALVPDGPK